MVYAASIHTDLKLSLAKVLEGWGWSAINAACLDGGVQGHKNIYFK